MHIDANKVIEHLSAQVGIQTSNYAKQVALLQAQVQSLSEENAKLKKENESLRKENDELKKALDGDAKK